MKIKTILLVTAGALSGCVISGSQYKDASVMNSISAGSTKAEVIQNLGNPTSSSAKGGAECLDYKFTRVGQSTYSGSEREHYVTLKNGKATCYGENSCEDVLNDHRNRYQECL